MVRSSQKDFLDELVTERTRRNPEFGRLLAAAERRRELLRGLARSRAQAGLSQTSLAASMKTSQSAVARLEAGEADARLSTVERFAAALGKRVEYRIVSDRRPSVQARAVAAKR